MEDLQISTSDDFVDMDDSSLGGRVIVVASSPKQSSMNYERCEDKAQEIRDCLQLHSESCGNTVDLWELRQLAISQGGLLSPTFRRVAWPLLAGLSASTSGVEDSKEECTGLDENMSEAMRVDIETSVWNLEDLVRQSQAGRESFWFTPLQQSHGDHVVSKSDNEAPGLVLSSPCSSSETSHDETLNTAITCSMKTKQNPQDQILLQKVLRDAVAGQTQYPQAGLANLASIFLVNLESTTRASQLLSQLATYPLKAAFGGAALGTSQMVMELLLEKFHPKQKWKAIKTTEKALAWFSGALTENVQASSRIIDACLVSHPMFPLYFGAAAISAPPAWTMEKVEELILKTLEYMEELPPAAVMEATKAGVVYSPAPMWAHAATATADWIPSIESTPLDSIPCMENCQQDKPFSDEDSNSAWERLSTTTESEGEEVAPTSEAFFLDSYRFFLALTAAGLGPSARKKSRSLLLPPPPEASTKGRRYLKLVFLISAWIVILAAGLSRQYSPGLPTARTSSNLPNRRTKAPRTSSSRRSMGHKMTKTSSSAPKEKFLGLVSIDRPAPKTVLRQTPTSKALAIAAASKTETRKETTEPEKKKDEPPLNEHNEKIFGVLSADRPAPKKVLRTKAPAPVDFSAFELDCLDQEPLDSRCSSTEAPVEAPKPVPPPVPASAETRDRKFQPLRPLKKQLPKVKNLWSKVTNFARRGKKKSVGGKQYETL